MSEDLFLSTHHLQMKSLYIFNVSPSFKILEPPLVLDIDHGAGSNLDFGLVLVLISLVLKYLSIIFMSRYRDLGVSIHQVKVVTS